MKKIYGWAILMRELDGDPAYIDFVSLNLSEVEKYGRETWDKDAYKIVQVSIVYE